MQVSARKIRAFTLVEILVVSGLFSMTLLAVYLIYHQVTEAERRTGAQNQAYRAVMLATKHLEMELRGAQLIQPSTWSPALTPAPLVAYYYPKTRNGAVEVDVTGTPVWDGRAHLELGPNGDLVKVDEKAGLRRVLSHLGANGKAEFWRPERDLLRVRVYAEIPDSFGRMSSHYEFRSLLRLANQP